MLCVQAEDDGVLFAQVVGHPGKKKEKGGHKSDQTILVIQRVCLLKLECDVLDGFFFVTQCTNVSRRMR